MGLNKKESGEKSYSMKKKILFLTVILIGVIGLGSAQSYTLTDADSNLSDTQLTADFSGLPQDTELILESLGSDITEQATFKSTSGGTATVSWRHNPFEDGTALIDDGWTYRIRDSSGSFNYEFEVAHGNMLLGLDTFNDNTINSELWDADQSVQETNQKLIVQESGSGSETAIFNESVKPQQTVFVSFSTLQSDSEMFTELVFLDSNYNQILEDELTDSSNGYNIKVFYDESSNEIRAVRTDTNTILLNTQYNKDDFYVGFKADGESTFSSDTANMRISNISIVPKISDNAFKQPNNFNPSVSNILFGEFLVNQPENVGLEFSNDTHSWSVTPPSSGNELYYRNTGSGSLGSVAVNTRKPLQSLTFNPIEPVNNSNTIIQDGSTVDEDFLYEILYQPPTDERRDLFVAWTLYNDETGDQIDQALYPSKTLDAGQETYFEEFTRTVNSLEAGNYRWEVQFRDNDLGAEKIFTNYFSYTEASNTPVSFELRDPSEGDTVNLTSGSYPFKYSVDTDDGGELSLKIPQFDTETRFSESISSGNITREVNLDLDYDGSYEWYLEYVKPESTTGTAGFDGFEDGDYTSNPSWRNSRTEGLYMTQNESQVLYGDYSVRMGNSSDFAFPPDTDDQFEVQYQGTGQPEFIQFSTKYIPTPNDNDDWGSNVGIGLTDADETIGIMLSYNSNGVSIESGGSNQQIYSAESLNGESLLNVEFRNINYTGDGSVDIYVNDTLVAGNYEWGTNFGTLSDYEFISIVGSSSFNDVFLFDNITYSENTISTSPEETYSSRKISFSTNENTTEPTNGDTDQGTDQPSSFDEFIDGNEIDLPGLYYFTVNNNLGISGDGADYLAGGIISIATGLILGVAIGSSALGGIGIMLGMLISGLVGLVPGWIVFIFTVLTGYVLAKVGVFGGN